MCERKNSNRCGNKMGQRNKRGLQENSNRTYSGRNHRGAFGLGGFCVCTKCGEKVPHTRGIKCTNQKCPTCNHALVREALLYVEEKVVQE